MLYDFLHLKLRKKVTIKVCIDMHVKAASLTFLFPLASLHGIVFTGILMKGGFPSQHGPIRAGSL